MAEMWKVIIKNNDASDYLVEDLGISVVASGSISFHEQFTYDEIAGSDDLRDAVSGSSLVVNDGSEDLAADSGADYLSLENLYHLGENYYDKTETGTISGSLQTQIDTYSDHGNLFGLGDDDHTQYSLADGTRDYTGIVSYNAPKTFTADAQIVDKKYVDDSVATASGGMDHGSLIGLLDDDHTQYILVGGTRAFTGVVSGVTPTLGSHLTTKQYVDSVAQGLDWQDSVLSIAPVASGVQTLGNRYISSATGGGWTEDNIYEWDGTQWVETVVNEGTAAWVEDEDALYVYNGSDWVRFGSTVVHSNLSGLQGGTVDEYYHLTSAQHTDLTDGGDCSIHKHDDRYYTETELDAGQLDNRYYTETELDAGQLDNRYYTETELQTSGQSSVHWDNITNAPDMAPNTLDDAYDEGGAGVGRTITVDAGAVKLDATSSGNAPIELTEQSTLPTLDLAGGQLSVKGGILYVYDSVRSKWLSVQRMFLTFGKKGKTKDQFLAFGAGELYSNNSGYRLARNATIVAITGQLDASGTCDMRIRRNDSATNIATLNISSAIGNSDTTPNVDLSANDYLQSYLESVAGAEDPVVVVELAWRE